MHKRKTRRYARRVQVQFWKRGSDQPGTGYTTDISVGGMFIATNSPLPPGARLRVQVLGEAGFTAECLVAHAARVSPLLQKLRKPGMGVRFLASEELVADLIPTPAGRGKKTAPETSEADERPAAVAPKRGRPPSEPDKVPIFPLRFPSLDLLLAAMDQEFKRGGAFIEARNPVDIDRVVSVAVHVPAPINRVLWHEARVVRRVDPEDAEGRRGIEVAFTDSEQLLEDLRALLPGWAVR